MCIEPAFWLRNVHEAVAAKLRTVPEDSFSWLAEIGHQIDADQRHAEDALKLEPFDQPDWINVSVGGVHTHC